MGSSAELNAVEKPCQQNCEKPWNGKLSATLKIRGGCSVDRFGKGAGKGPLVQWEKSGTLGVSQDQTLFVWSTPYKGGCDINRER